MSSFVNGWLVLAGLGLGWALAAVLKIARLSRISSRLPRLKPYEQAGSQTGPRILVLGDSVAFGLGASSSAASIAGLLGHQFPRAQIINQGQIGLQTEQLASNLAVPGLRYDLIVITIGANDIIRPWINLKKSAQHLQAIYRYASEHAGQVATYTTANLSTCRLFLWPLNRYIGRRSLWLRQAAKAIAGDLPNVSYVDLFPGHKTFASDHHLLAADQLHLSDEGTKFWYEAMQQATKNFNRMP